MSTELPTTIVITPDGGELASPEVREGTHHHVRAGSDPGNGDILLDFSTRRAMYDFALSLLHEAVYGTSGQQEFYPLSHDGDALVVNGVRMSADSSRLLVFYGSEGGNGCTSQAITASASPDSGS